MTVMIDLGTCVYFKPSRSVAFALLFSVSDSLTLFATLSVMCTYGAGFPPQQGDGCCSGKVGQKVVLVPALQLPSVCHVLSQVLVPRFLKISCNCTQLPYSQDFFLPQGSCLHWKCWSSFLDHFFSGSFFLASVFLYGMSGPQFSQSK